MMEFAPVLPHFCESLPLLERVGRGNATRFGVPVMVPAHLIGGSRIEGYTSIYGNNRGLGLGEFLLEGVESRL